MAYSDFTVESAVNQLGIVIDSGALFPHAIEQTPPSLLVETLALARRHAPILSEKARSEMIVIQVLLTACDCAPRPTSLYSGQRFDVDGTRELVGECDFLISATKPLLSPSAPVLTVVEAKRSDLELGLGPCIAQMVAAQQVNRQAGIVDQPVYGCVTTGEVWQFMRLDELIVTIDLTHIYISQLGLILGILDQILRTGMSEADSSLSSH